MRQAMEIEDLIVVRLDEGWFLCRITKIYNKNIRNHFCSGFRSRVLTRLDGKPKYIKVKFNGIDYKKTFKDWV